MDLSLILVTAIVASLAKPFLEIRVNAAHPLHDTSVRLIAIVVGLVSAFVDYAVHGGTLVNGAALEAAAGKGLVAGVGAVVIYHLLTADVWSSLSASSATLVAPSANPVLVTPAPAPTTTTPETAPFPTPPAV